jgi:uncharacterized beta-barrel protein YwiB (DUF1934 family)
MLEKKPTPTAVEGVVIISNSNSYLNYQVIVYNTEKEVVFIDLLKPRENEFLLLRAGTYTVCMNSQAWLGPIRYHHYDNCIEKMVKAEKEHKWKIIRKGLVEEPE